MRTSVIAEEALSRGYECVFVGSIEHLDWVSTYIKSIGYTDIISNPEDFESNSETDILILDLYTNEDKSKFNDLKCWKFVVLIADAVTPEFACNLIIRPNLNAPLAKSESVPEIGGAEFMLMRKSINKIHGYSLRNTKLKLLVSGGGSDPYLFSENIARIIDELDIDCETHFFVDRSIVSESSKEFITHNIGGELDSFAGEADLVFCTASTSSFEFIARGLPVGVVCAVNNQVENYDQLINLGLAAGLGFRDDSGQWKFNKELIRKLMSDFMLRKSYSDKVLGLIDLKGATRVLGIIEDSLM